MEVPASLMRRIALFKTNGRVIREGNELFAKMSWLQVLHGQRIHPRSYHPLVDLLSEREIQAHVDEVKAVVKACVTAMPSHMQVIASHCAAAR